MNIEDYHNDTTHFSKSTLDLINRSPWHYYQAKLSGKKQQQKSTKALEFGSAYHDYILSPDVFAGRYAIEPTFNGTGSTARRSAWMQTVGNKSIISLQDFRNIEAMRDVLFKNPLTRQMLTGGVAEETLKWTDALTGLKCKCRPDYRLPNGYIVDLKSTDDARKAAFERSSYKYRYHVQDAFYCDGATAAGHEIKGFIFIAQEKNAPFATGIYVYGSDENLRTAADCIESGNWPTYNDGEITELNLPGWA
jgi:hypothetical protein